MRKKLPTGYSQVIRSGYIFYGSLWPVECKLANTRLMSNRTEVLKIEKTLPAERLGDKTLTREDKAES